MNSDGHTQPHVNFLLCLIRSDNPTHLSQGCSERVLSPYKYQSLWVTMKNIPTVACKHTQILNVKPVVTVSLMWPKSLENCSKALRAAYPIKTDDKHPLNFNHGPPSFPLKKKKLKKLGGLFFWVTLNNLGFGRDGRTPWDRE